ncbi:choline sulfate utilization transcriptional regulator [Ciceribacter sp. RN22]|uniref:choline sulfate utilization transcriptional regulator n=1 Tax=Ciceribacter sp. RN22 TaxID=2954932 RepID=UPI0020935FA2|nr:LysR family transcriptional regulator [Ciceribacter sp. RN22]MCO6179092.1 LysR family transcriptional regulator [Ciceribacter sp. RN22]
MRRRPVDLGWMRVFVEATRQGSLTAAANVLNMSQPAISYHIRRAEEDVGVALFERVHRGVELTPAGRALYEIARRAVGDIDDAVHGFHAERDRATIRLLTDYAFSSLWLMPRMQVVRRLHPELDIQIVATQRFQQARLAENEIAVVFGAKSDVKADALLLVPEVVTPVCTPAFAERNGPFDDPSSLARSTLIHLDSPSQAPWFKWTSYLSHFGAKREAQAGHVDLTFNTYSLVVQAAIAGQGIAIGWEGLVDASMMSGVLAAAGPTLQAPGRGYWLMQPDQPGRHVEWLARWLVSEAKDNGWCAGV